MFVTIVCSRLLDQCHHTITHTHTLTRHTIAHTLTHHTITHIHKIPHLLESGASEDFSQRLQLHVLLSLRRGEDATLTKFVPRVNCESWLVAVWCAGIREPKSVRWFEHLRFDLSNCHRPLFFARLRK